MYVNLTEDDRPLVSAAIREVTERDPHRLFILNLETYRKVVTAQQLPVEKKLDALLQALGKRCMHPGRETRINPSVDYPLIQARSPEELMSYLKYAEQLGLVRAGYSFNDGVDYELTIPGWQKLEPVRTIGGEPGTCFVAMWFSQELEEAYELGILSAVEQDCGMKAVRIDRVEHNNQITDEIMAGIRGAQFMVADFTGHRSGVYYEAGFARGLGREVIYCCRRDSFAERHFDTSVINHIVWTEPADLRTSLANRIKATILPKA